MKLGKRQYLIVFAVCVAMILGVVFLCVYTSQEDISNLRKLATLNAEVYSETLEKDFQQGIEITESLEELLIDTKGSIQDFDSVAKHRMEKSIASIQLAPGGVVTDIYPFEGNEAGKLDLLNDPDRGPIVRFGKEHDVVTMQGPFEMKQGGMGIALRNPVFLSDENENAVFWGFTIVIIRVPDIYKNTLDTLEAFGYDYRLDTTVSPLSRESKKIASSLKEGEKLDNAAGSTFVAGECTWTLNVVPKSGWTSRRFWWVALGGAVYATLIATLTYMFLGLREQHRKLQKIAVTDELTGLLSRRGFIEQLGKTLDANAEIPMTAVFIDLDDFKQINDLYGHLIGDEVLKNLARNLESVFPKNSLIGRSGGDEFCVIISGKTAEESAAIIQKAVEMDQTFFVESKAYSYTISAGYADYPMQATDRRHLLTLADQALYASKVTGKNKCVRYESSMSDIKRTQLGFSVKNITAGIPGAFMIYSATGDEQILFANDDLIEMMGCTGFNDFLEHTKCSFRYFVHPEDVDRVEESIRAQIYQQAESGVAKNRDDYVEYRIITRAGREKTVLDLGRLVHTENYGDVFFVFLREKGNGMHLL